MRLTVDIPTGRFSAVKPGLAVASRSRSSYFAVCIGHRVSQVYRKVPARLSFP